MAATFAFAQDNGAASGSPAHGTRTNPVTDASWKNADDTTTAASAAPVSAGSNSFDKWLYGAFTGSFTLISSVLWAHTAGTFGTGLTLKGVVTSSYTTPATTANANLTTDMTAAISIGAGASVNLSTTSPQAGSPTSTLAAAGFTQYLPTQVQTSSGAAAGPNATITLTLQYSES